MFKAIFLSGASGSGKSFIAKRLVTGFEHINVDDSYEELLKASGLGTNQKDFNADQLSQAAKLMQQARKSTADKFDKLSKRGNNILIDGTGASSNPILEKKQQLEALGYKTFMVMVYSSIVTSLERNKNRERSLLPHVVMRSWKSVVENVDVYKKAFGNNFVLINNDGENPNKDFDPEFIKKTYFDTAGFKSKPKTPEELAKSKKEKDELNNSIKSLAKNPPKPLDYNLAKSKIDNFIK
jgi:predicted kinase